MLKSWIDARMKERTSWDGAALIVLGLMVLFLAPQLKQQQALLLHTVLGLFGKKTNMILNITENAKDYLKKVGKPNVSLSVKGGGCSGFQYEWGVTDKEATVGNLWLDPMAEMFIFGCTVDYVEELGGSYLKVVNPNATASCGCGESFAV